MSERFKWRRHALVALGSFLLFWIGDALVDAFFWGDPFPLGLFEAGRRELSIRGIYSTLLSMLMLALSLLFERRRWAEADLRASDEFSRIFFESATDAICVIESDGLAIKGVNGIFLGKYGLTEKQALGMSFPELIGSRHLPGEIVIRLVASVAAGGAANHEISYPGVDGETIYEEVSIHPIGLSRHGIERVLQVTRDVTVHRRSEALLKESEARYRAIFENTGTAMAIVRPDGVLHLVNREFEAVTGYDRRQLEGDMLLTEFVSAGDRGEMLQRMAMVDHCAASPQSFELQTVDRLGATKAMAGNLAAIAGTDRAVLSLVDISAQKRVEEELRENRATLAVAQRIARLGNWEWDLVTDTLIWSEEMYRIFAVEPGGFRPTHEWGLQAVHPEDRETVIRSVNDAIYNKKGYQLDYRIVLPGGVVRSISARGEVTYDAHGSPLRMVGTNQDVTWRNEAEQALRSSEEKFSKAFHASPDSIVISRADDGTYIDVNEAFLDHTGYTRDEVIGKNAAEMKIWADLEARMVMLRLLNRYGHVRNLDVRFRMKSGEIRELLWSADVIEYQGNACLIAISRDVTEQRHLEKELLESEAKLYMQHEELIKLFHQMEGIRREWEETIDCLSDMFIVADTSGKIRRFNRAVESFTGKTHREIVGREYLQFLEEHGLKGHLQAPGTELFHEPSGKWLVLKCYSFQSAELDDSTREVVIINDTSDLGLRSALPPAKL